MFDHCIPSPSKSNPVLAAAFCLLIAVAAILGFRYWSTRGMRSANLNPVAAVSSPATPSSNQNAPLATRTASAVPGARREAPISNVAILVFKSEKRVEVWGNRAETWSRLRDYPVLAASGAAGPKLREGDRQVPEGIYRIALMNPQSRFHQSIKLDYPNAFDRKMGDADGRSKLGGDICIHGKNCSVGCVAIGDPAIEDLYALVERVGPANTKIVIAPNDLRTHIPVRNPYLKLPWLDLLYKTIGDELKNYRN